MLFCAVLLVSCISAAFSAANPITSALTVIWGQIDVNKSGKLEKDEYFAVVFQAYDANHDKKISEAEYLKNWMAAYSHQHDAGVSVFNQIDANGDHFWTDSDLTASFNKMDSNGNGLVSKEEFIAYAGTVLTVAQFTPDGGIIG